MNEDRIKDARKAIVCMPLACDDASVAAYIAALLKEAVDEVERLRAKAMTFDELAEHLDMSVEYLFTVLRQNGMKYLRLHVDDLEATKAAWAAERIERFRSILDDNPREFEDDEGV